MNKQDEEKAKELYPDFERDLLYQNRVKKLQRKAFIQGVAWKEQQIIERVIDYLKHAKYLSLDDEGEICVNKTDIIEGCKKAMMEE